MLCVPLMLLPKPIILLTIQRLKEKKRGGGRGKNLRLNYNVEDALVIDDHFDKKSKKQGLLVGEKKVIFIIFILFKLLKNFYGVFF